MPRRNEILELVNWTHKLQVSKYDSLIKPSTNEHKTELFNKQEWKSPDVKISVIHHWEQGLF